MRKGKGAGRQEQIPGYKETCNSSFRAKQEQESSTDKLATDWYMHVGLTNKVGTGERKVR